MKMNKNSLLLLVLIATALPGCASRGPSFGETVRAEGLAVKGIGENWEKGQALIRKGNKLIRSGNKQIAQGKEDVADGTSMVKTGEKLVADAERDYEYTKPRESGN